MEFSELPDEAKEPLLNFVRALARRRARIDAAKESQTHALVSASPSIKPDQKPMTTDDENGLKLSEALTPRGVVDILQSKGISVSERTLREKARKLGACRIIGKAMFLMPEDIDAILEAAKPDKRHSVGEAPSGDFAALVKLREKQARADLDRKAAKSAERENRNTQRRGR